INPNPRGIRLIEETAPPPGDMRGGSPQGRTIREPGAGDPPGDVRLDGQFARHGGPWRVSVAKAFNADLGNARKGPSPWGSGPGVAGLLLSGVNTRT
ncbi:hypothetical protein, partial [Vreelandella rituensis]|uniref:hypothetical protein n=1 Tax=Vreelandella rituensis TaxID=2282306 RepID=UPI0039EEE97D